MLRIKVYVIIIDQLWDLCPRLRSDAQNTSRSSLGLFVSTYNSKNI